MHVWLGGVYEHGVWDPDIIRGVFSSHSKSYLGSQVVRKPVVFPVLPKKNVQSEFLKNDLKIRGFIYNITQVVTSLNLTCATHETVKQGEIKAHTIFTVVGPEWKEDIFP